MGLFSSKETVVHRYCHWQAHQRARKSQNEQGKTHILQQWRDQKRLLFPAAVPGISLDSWSLWLEIPASFATAYRISCWEMPRHSFLLQWLPSSLWSAGKRWEMITSISRNSHESTKYCHLIEVFFRVTGRERPERSRCEFEYSGWWQQPAQFYLYKNISMHVWEFFVKVLERNVWDEKQAIVEYYLF